MTLHVWVSITIYYQLYKITSQVSLVTALIEQDHFLYLSSFMDKYFSGNVFKFLIFFNLLTNKFWISLALSREVNHQLFAADVTHSCARAQLIRIKTELTEKASWYQQSQIGVVWFCQLNLSYDSEFVHLPSWYMPLVLLVQGSQTQLLEGRCPAEFNSIPN